MNAEQGTWIAVAMSFLSVSGLLAREIVNAWKEVRTKEIDKAIAVQAAVQDTRIKANEEKMAEQASHLKNCDEQHKVTQVQLKACQDLHRETQSRLEALEAKVVPAATPVAT